MSQAPGYRVGLVVARGSGVVGNGSHIAILDHALDGGEKAEAVHSREGHSPGHQRREGCDLGMLSQRLREVLCALCTHAHALTQPRGAGVSTRREEKYEQTN